MTQNFNYLAAAALFVALLFTSCSSHDEPQDPNDPSRELVALQLGALSVASSPAVSKAEGADFADGQSVAVTARPDASGTTRNTTYIYNKVGGWSPDGLPIYYEDVATGYSFSAVLGESELITDQSTEAAFVSADYITGPLVIDANHSAPTLITADTPLEHRNVQIEVTLERGTGWTDATWTGARMSFDFRFFTTAPDVVVVPFGETFGTLFRARMPLASVPTPGGADIFSIKIDNKVKTASYTLAGTLPIEAGMLLSLSVKVHAGGELSPIRATVTGWEDKEEMEFVAERTHYIYTADDLFALAARVNGGDNCEKIIFILMDNINLENKQWTPIGNFDNHFAGTFNGNGKSINNFKVTEEEAGLFGYIEAGGKVEHLMVCNAEILSENNAGTIVGWNGGSIEGCVATASNLKSITHAGGIAGMNHGSIAACLFSGKVTDSPKAGGLVGWNGTTDGTVIAASISLADEVTGEINGTIAGVNTSSILSCRWKTGGSGATDAKGGGYDPDSATSSFTTLTVADISVLNAKLAEMSSPYRWQLDDSNNPVIIKP